MSLPSTYKPSPLSFGSPRTSPFRRPESPASPSTAIRPATPTRSPSPTKSLQTPQSSPSKLMNASTPSHTESWTPRGLAPTTAREIPASPTRSSSAATTIAAANSSNMTRQSDALLQLPASQVREMREAFSLLDRNDDGLVNRDDVVDVLTNLGQPSDLSSVSPFFPPGAPQTQPLPIFLSTLSSLLAPLSSQTELLNAFAAFDEKDSGEIDVGDLRDALLNTAPEPGERGVGAREVEEVLGGYTGRRAFGKEMRGTGLGQQGRGEVFRYREWIGGVMGGDEKKEDGK